MMKTLAIVIRAHGLVPIHFEYGMNDADVLGPITLDYRKANIDLMTMVTLAKFGGECFGSSNIKEYAAYIQRIDSILREQENVKNTDELVEYLYGPKPKLNEITQVHQHMFQHSYNPTISNLQGFVVNKLYTNDPNMEGLGIYYLKSNGFNDRDVSDIKRALQNLTEQLTSPTKGYIYRTDILQALEPFNIFKLYFIDFSCFGYVNQNPDASAPLNEHAVNWLNESIARHGLKGGKRKKSRRKSRTMKRRK